MSLNSLYRLTYVQSQNDVRFANVIAFKQTSVSGSIDAKLSLANAFESDVEPGFAAALTDQWGSRCIQVRQLELPGQDFFRLATSGVGTLTDEPLPSEVCAQIKFFTDNFGIGWTGRIFISGIPITGEEDNCLTSVQAGLVDSLGAVLTQEIADAGVTFRAGLYKGNGDFFPFIACAVKTALTVQRSRKQPISC